MFFWLNWINVGKNSSAPSKPLLNHSFELVSKKLIKYLRCFWVVCLMAKGRQAWNHSACTKGDNSSIVRISWPIPIHLSMKRQYFILSDVRTIHPSFNETNFIFILLDACTMQTGLDWKLTRLWKTRRHWLLQPKQRGVTLTTWVVIYVSYRIQYATVWIVGKSSVMSTSRYVRNKIVEVALFLKDRTETSI